MPSPKVCLLNQLFDAESSTEPHQQILGMVAMLGAPGRGVGAPYGV